MLSIARMLGGQQHYYLDLAREDYYTDGGEPPGRWMGEGAKSLGLTGKVASEHLNALFEGLAPHSHTPLVQLQQYPGRATRQPGWDMTFSAPKSVSVAWAISDESMRKAIGESHRRAVWRVMRWVEKNALLTRRGRGGAHREPAKLVAAAFEHGTSRAQDPQLHSHVLVLNVGIRDDGTTGTITSLDLYKAKMLAGAFYRCELARGIKQRTSVALRQDQFGFKIKEVPSALVEKFSTRRKEIEIAAREGGWSSPRALELLCLSTRKVKEHIAHEALRERWSAVGEEHGITSENFGPLVLEEPAHFVCRTTLRAQLEPSIEELVRYESTFTARDFLRELASRSSHLGCSIPELHAAVNQHLEKSYHLVEVSSEHGESRYTTRELLSVERRLVAIAHEGRYDRYQLVPLTIFEDVLARRAFLSQEQKDALRHVTRNQGLVQCFEGIAGSGKTTALEAAHVMWRRSGYRVLGCAFTGHAARILQSETGVASTTVHSLLSQLSRHPIAPRTVLVVDEASLVPTRQMARLIEEAARADARIVLCGDRKQLQSIEAGIPFHALIRGLGSARIDTIRRQKEPWAAHAVEQAMAGDMRGVLSQFQLAGRLHVEKTKQKTMETLVDSWAKYPKQERALILACTRVDVHSLNLMAQRARRERNELRGMGVTCGDDVRYYSGDRVLIARNDHARGVYNGELGEIEQVINQGRYQTTLVQIRLDRKERDHLGLEHPRRVTMPLVEGRLQLGYAMTSHKSMGTTTRNTMVLLGGGPQHRELTYVQVSRASDRTDLFTDEVTAGDDLSVLRAQMERSRAKKLAHEQSTNLNELLRLQQYG